MPSNEHIINYLKYYAAFTQAPRFAVLVDGRWGIGKTHLIDAFLESVRTAEFKAVYVSLNGLTSFEEIDRELFRVMHTVMGSRLFSAAASLGKSGLRAIRGVSVDVNLLDLINRYTADLYVFDDLERCGMPAVQALAYINAFVEHGGRKVIVVANQAEIEGGEAKAEPKGDYGRTREKVIGRTLVFQSAIDDALAAFIAKIRSERTGKFLAAKVAVIKAIHDQAELHNLRILQQALWDFERFYEVLEDRHRDHDVAMTAMLRLLLALSMELRGDRLKEDDLKGRVHAIVHAVVRRQPDPNAAAFLRSRQRYPGADIDSTALSDATLIALLIDGVVDKTAIRRDLDASTYFVVVGDEPPWRTLWHGLERSDEEVATAQAAVEAAFRERAYDDPGVILHVFGLRLKLARIGVLPLSPQEVVAECERYVDDLYAAGRLRPASGDERGPALRESGYDGLQITDSSTPEYAGLFAYLENTRAQAASDRLPQEAATLLEALRTVPDRFIDEIAPCQGRGGRAARVPLLTHIAPDTFVAALMGHRPDVQRQVLNALRSRYEHRILSGELAPELSWAQTVRAGLAASIPAMPSFGQYRMTLFLENSLDKVPELLPAPQP